MTNLGNHNLLRGLAEAARYHKQRPALFLKGKHFSYETFSRFAHQHRWEKVAASLQDVFQKAIATSFV